MKNYYKYFPWYESPIVIWFNFHNWWWIFFYHMLHVFACKIAPHHILWKNITTILKMYMVHKILNLFYIETFRFYSFDSYICIHILVPKSKFVFFQWTNTMWVTHGCNGIQAIDISLVCHVFLSLELVIGKLAFTFMWPTIL
jgi:hypothetical protein